MSISTKIFFVEENLDSIKQIPYNRFKKLFSGDKSEYMKEYADRLMKYVTVLIELDNRKPINILDIRCNYIRIDREGKFDRDFINEMNLAAMETLSINDIRRSDNIFDIKPQSAKEKFRNKYTWQITRELEKEILRNIFM